MRLLRTASTFGLLCSLHLVRASFPSSHETQLQIQPHRIAIIGAGAAGTSTSYHLRKFANQAHIPLNITIFDRNPYIGGRSTTVNAYGDESQPVELGASIYVAVNKILVDAIDEFNLSSSEPDMMVATDGSNAPALGFFDGTQFVYTIQGDSWWDIAKLGWHYGLYSVYRTQALMKEMVSKFVRLYDEPLFPWGSLTEVVYEIGLSEIMAKTGEELLRENRISEKFAREFVQSATRVNYAQNLRTIHAIEAMVCLATDGAMSVDGGNWQVFANMAKSSADFIHLSKAVSSIEKAKDGKFMIGTKSQECCESEADSPSVMTEVFDSVVLASPHQHASLHFSPDPQFIPEKVPYVDLHVTLFTSPCPLAASGFNLPSGQPVPLTVLTTLPEGEIPVAGNKSQAGSPGFYSISTLRQVQNPETGKSEYLYKIFSPTVIDAKFLAQILGLPQPSQEDQPFPIYPGGTIWDLPKDQVTWIHRKLWQSYPYGFPRSRFEKLRLDDGIWYTAGMEGFISTMETSALSGANVARLLVDELIRRRDEDGTHFASYVMNDEQKPLRSKL